MTSTAEYAAKDVEKWCKMYGKTHMDREQTKWMVIAYGRVKGWKKSSDGCVKTELWRAYNNNIDNHLTEVPPECSALALHEVKACLLMATAKTKLTAAKVHNKAKKAMTEIRNRIGVTYSKLKSGGQLKLSGHQHEDNERLLKDQIWRQFPAYRKKKGKEDDRDEEEEEEKGDEEEEEEAEEEEEPPGVETAQPLSPATPSPTTNVGDMNVPDAPQAVQRKKPEPARIIIPPMPTD